MSALPHSNLPLRVSRLLGLVCLVSLAGIGMAHAQFNPNSGYGPLVDGKGGTQTQAAKPPPGLPGAAANQDRSVSTERTQNADLPPTEALFEAIDRGDMLAARDAVNRGADLTATNVLGMTPIDESIDLSRNAITFMLLSLRGAQPSGPPMEVAAGKPNGKPGAKGQAAAPKAKPVPVVVAKQQAAPRPVAEVTPNRPPPGGGGSPNPQAGFLGFGG